MSHFIARSIQFNHDLTQVKLKGSDNNVYPKTQEWSHFYPISGLFEDYNNGSVKLAGYNEKICLTEYVLGLSNDVDQFAFLLKGYYVNYVPSAKNYVVCSMFKFVVSQTKNWLNVSRESGRAKTYSKYAAIKISKRSDNFEAVKVSELKDDVKQTILNNPKNQ